MAESDVEARLAVLEAKEEIRELIALYCATNDRMDSIDLLASLFTEDAIMSNPTGSHTGRAAIHGYYTKFFDGSVKFSRHHVMNQVITILEPGVARHEAYFIAMLGRDGESKIVYGRYFDLLVKEADGWRFKDKINDIVAPTTLAAGWADGFPFHEPMQGTR
jgi:uncharacterized protein (TIGR02246 family)